MKPYDKQLVLENGKQFFGYGFGADKSAINEIVFNTSMVGDCFRPQLYRSNGRDDLPAHRQLRYDR
jgi:hypothetical protein